MTNDYILVNWGDRRDLPPHIDTTDRMRPGTAWLKVTHHKDGWTEETEDGIERFRPYLSPREFEVAQLVSESYSQRKAGKLLGISRGTIREYFDRVKRKIRCVLEGK